MSSLCTTEELESIEDKIRSSSEFNQLTSFLVDLLCAIYKDTYEKGFQDGVNHESRRKL